MLATKDFEARYWRTSKYPLRIILRAAFVTYMWYGIWNYYSHPGCKMDKKLIPFIKLVYFFVDMTLAATNAELYKTTPKTGANGFEVGYTRCFLPLDFITCFCST